MTFHWYADGAWKKQFGKKSQKPVLKIGKKEEVYRCWVATIPNNGQFRSVKILSKIDDKSKIVIVIIFVDLEDVKHYQYIRGVDKKEFMLHVNREMMDVEEEFKGLKWQEVDRYQFHLGV